MAALREEMVENGVKFLRHPNVQTTPLSERVSFLEQKGMTKEEIQESIERFQNGDEPTAAATPATANAPSYAQQQQPQMLHNYPQQQQQMLSTPMAFAAATAPMQQLARRATYPPYIRVLWALSSLVGAASILTFMWNYAVQSGYIPWLRSPLLLAAADAQAHDDAAQQAKDDALVAELAAASSAIQAQTAQLATLCASLETNEKEIAIKSALATQIAASVAEQTTNQAIAELRAEISTLKALVVATNATPAPAAAPLLASVSTASTAADEKKEEDELKKNEAEPVVEKPPRALIARAEKLEATLKLLRTQNSLEQLQLAAGILTMYVKNLVENPDVPRYRRIAPGNANFKQKVAPLLHHDALLQVIGFETTHGVNMEWKGHMADRTPGGAFDDNIALLRATLKALQSLTTKTTLSLEEIARASVETYMADPTPTPTLTSSAESLATKTSTVLPPQQKNDLDSFMARLEKNQASVSDAIGKKPVAPVENETKTETTDELVGDDNEEKLPATAAAVALAEAENVAVAAAKEETPAATAGPTYPSSFTDVMKLIQNGETVPGIKDIEEKLSVDAETLLRADDDNAAADESGDSEHRVRTTAPAKPWETAVKA